MTKPSRPTIPIDKNLSPENEKEIREVVKMVGERIALYRGQRKNLVCVELGKYSDFSINSVFLALIKAKYKPMIAYSETDDCVRLYIKI